MSVEVAERPSPPLSAPVAGGPIPPGPRAPSLVQTGMVMRDPSGFLIRCRERFGDCYRARFVGTPPIAYVARPDLVKAVFDTDKGAGLAGAVRAAFMETLVGQHSLLTLDGEEWLRQRRLLGPPFHGEAIERYGEQISEIAAAEIETWPLGEPLKLRPRMQVITLEVILRVVFGLEDSERRDRLRVLLPRLISQGMWTMWMPRPVIAALGRLSAAPAALRRVNPYARLIELRDEVDSLLYAEIADRRAAVDGSDREDILSILLEARDEDGEPMSDQELRDELITLLEAGHETTATGLAWTFERLVRHPAVLARLEAELESGDEAYVEAVTRESLRLRPVITDTLRLLVEPLDLDGFTVPEGWWVGVAIAALHMNPAVWDEPRAFRPERFLDAPVPPHAWAPFGGGQRRCIGSRLAMLEMQAATAEVVRRLRLRPTDARAERAPLHHVTMVPARQAEVIAEARPPARA